MIIPDDLDTQIQQALSYFWSTREKQIERQKNSDETDRGNRGAVTGGKQLDGFVALVRDVLVQNGIQEKKIFFDSDLELPGYFRPNICWWWTEKSLCLQLNLKARLDHPLEIILITVLKKQWEPHWIYGPPIGKGFLEHRKLLG